MVCGAQQAGGSRGSGAPQRMVTAPSRPRGLAGVTAPTGRALWRLPRQPPRQDARYRRQREISRLRVCRAGLWTME